MLMHVLIQIPLTLPVEMTQHMNIAPCSHTAISFNKLFHPACFPLFLRSRALILLLITNRIRHVVYACMCVHVCLCVYLHFQVQPSAVWMVDPLLFFSVHRLTDSQARGECVCVCVEAGQETFAPFILPLTTPTLSASTRPANGSRASLPTQERWIRKFRKTVHLYTHAYTNICDYTDGYTFAIVSSYPLLLLSLFHIIKFWHEKFNSYVIEKYVFVIQC